MASVNTKEAKVDCDIMQDYGSFKNECFAITVIPRVHTIIIYVVRRRVSNRHYPTAYSDDATNH